MKLIDRYIGKYGAIEGKARLKARNKKISDTRKKMNLTDSNSRSLESYVARYGTDIGTEKYNKYKDKRKNINTEEYFIEKYGNKKGSEIYKSVKKKRNKFGKINSLEWYLNKYGKNEGLAKYYERCNALHKNRYVEHNPTKATGESRKIFDIIAKMCNDLGIKYMYGVKDNAEFFIYEKENTLQNFFSYDFTIPDLGIIIEFNGSHVHPNPKMTKEERDSWRHAYTKKDADSYDLLYENKIKVAENRGYEVIIVWDTDDYSGAISNIKRRIHSES